METHESGEELVVRVADRGPGIQDPFLKLVFEPFQRVSSSLSEGASGTGLGLSIAADLTCRQQGSLRLIESDRGAVFELRVPVRRVITPLPGQQLVA